MRRPAAPWWSTLRSTCAATNYQARYRELASDTGCYLHDPLPDLWQNFTKEERRAFRFKRDPHLSPNGHKALALSLAPAIERIMADSKR
jgi:hypothetical protein